MMKRAIFGLFLLTALNAESQNLVPNSSFEDYVQCPWSLGVLAECAPPWFSAVAQSYPSYFNACAESSFPSFSVPDNSPGYQPARTGEAYAAIALYYNPDIIGASNHRMYIEVELSQALETDTLDCVAFYLSLVGDFWDMCAVANVGMYLSVDSISDTSNDTLSFVPQISNDSSVILTDTVNWMVVSGTYHATGGEKYITIGNFTPDDYTNAINVSGGEAYYYVDDVSVIKCSQLTSTNDLVENKMILTFIQILQTTLSISATKLLYQSLH